MSDENAPIVYTLKHGKNYDDSWTVFRGRADTIRQNAMEMFGITEDQVPGYSAAQVLEAIRQTIQSDGIELGEVAEAEPVNEHPGLVVETDDSLLSKVQSAKTERELLDLWTRHKDQWDEKVNKAAGDRKKELASGEGN